MIFPYILTAIGLAVELFATIFKSREGLLKGIGFVIACIGLLLAYLQKVDDDRDHKKELTQQVGKTDSLAHSLELSRQAQSSADSAIIEKAIASLDSSVRIINLLISVQKTQLALTTRSDSTIKLGNKTVKKLDTVGFSASANRPIISKYNDGPTPMLILKGSTYVITYQFENVSDIPAEQVNCQEGIIFLKDDIFYIDEKLAEKITRPLGSYSRRTTESTLDTFIVNKMISQGFKAFYYCHTTYTDKFAVQKYAYSFLSEFTELKINTVHRAPRMQDANNIKDYLNRKIFNGEFKF